MARCSNCNHPFHSTSPPAGPSVPTNSAPAPKKEKHYTEYEYSPLKRHRGYIRIFVLLGNDSPNADVECELKDVPFAVDNKLQHPYEALSWCWGSSDPTGRIFIREGKTHKKRFVKWVNPDLVAALKALRYQGKDRRLWIDQVCINQGDPLEKNHQVEIMSEIYGRASRVCIWLGEGDKSSRMALKFIKQEVLQLQNFDELCESEKASEKWGALLDLMQRPWFSRRWVVQEVALAHRAIVYCGADKLSWKKLRLRLSSSSR